jgi:multiple sugar transport system permease protein
MGKEGNGMINIVRWLGRLKPKTPVLRRTLIGYIFISPFILGFVLWFLGPALTAIWLAFTDWNLLRPPVFIGLDNFQKLFRDELVLQSLKVTTIYTLVSVPLRLLSSFAVALLLNNKVRGMKLFRTIYYIPSIVPAVANAILWAWVLNSEFGLLNALLRSLGMRKVLWLQEPEWALPAFILMNLWSLGSSMVICLAGLQGIPEVLYEAAEIDGAGRWAKLVYVTIPQMSPVLFFNLVMGVIWSFQVFTAGYLITNGGPQNATLFYVLYLYRNAFEFLDMGYAAVLAGGLFLIIFGLTGLIFKVVGSKVYYEEGYV